jgi:hypothetical protein
MPTASFRFHGELEDLLPARRRGRPVALDAPEGATLKHAIESLDVPHTEVGSITVDGRDTHLSDRLADAATVDVHPRPAGALPGGEPRFVADAHLAGLARGLRLLGFDTLLATDGPDRELAQIADLEGRILLSRDRELLKHGRVRAGRWVRALRRDEQLREVIRAFGLQPLARPFTRCMECNGRLRPADPQRVAGRVPPGVERRHSRFDECEGCGRVYWAGSHWARLDALVRSLASSGAPARPPP